jgi:hypothetical protein
MGKKMKVARKIIKAGRFALPSPTEVEAARTGAGGWKAAVLASWGVKWPPQQGWKTELRRCWAVAHPREAAELDAFENAATATRSAQADDDLSTEYRGVMGAPEFMADRPRPGVTIRKIRAAASARRRNTSDDMVITDGMKPDGTLRVLTGDAARRAWLEPIRPVPKNMPW